MSGVLAVIAPGAAALSAVISPTGLSGIRVGSGTIVTSAPAITTAYGGQAPYTYLWTYASGSALVYANSPTSASSYFSCYFSTPGSSETAVYKCVVTDANAATVDTAEIEISIESL